MPAPEELKPRLAAAIDAAWPAQRSFLDTLVAFPSTRGNEAPCQDFLARSLGARGYAVDRWAIREADIRALRGFSPVMDTDYATCLSVVGTKRAESATGRSLILQGHIDVVPAGPEAMWSTPPFQPTERDGWLHGRGANDMKAGVSCMIFALDALAAIGLAPSADVHVQTVSEEESTGNGALSTLARGYRADAALIPEPTGHTITRAAVGCMWFRLRVQGRPVHVARAESGTNAILSAYALLRALEDHTARINADARTDPWFGETPRPLKFNPGKISGGDWASSTPAWCEVDCRIGVLPGASLADARAGVENTVRAAAAQDPFLREHPPAVIWNGFQAEGYVQDPRSEAEAMLGRAHAAVHGAGMEERRSTAVNDGRFYRHAGMPALVYGPMGEGSHGFDERVNLASVKATTLAIALFVAEWCGVRQA
jgi:acetylornithine deacetylase